MFIFKLPAIVGTMKVWSLPVPTRDNDGCCKDLERIRNNKLDNKLVNNVKLSQVLTYQSWLDEKDAQHQRDKEGMYPQQNFAAAESDTKISILLIH